MNKDCHWLCPSLYKNNDKKVVACCQGWGSHSLLAKEERDQAGRATASGDEDMGLYEIFRNSAAPPPPVLGPQTHMATPVLGTKLRSSCLGSKQFSESVIFLVEELGL